MASRSPAEELDVDGVAVRMSNPDKIYFPELGENGGRKRDLVGYYRTVALGDTGGRADDSGDGPLMRATRDRPTFLQRFPDGVEGEEIYQKHIAKKRPEHVRSTPIVFPSKRTGDAIRPTVPADLVWGANLGTVTFHTWPTLHPDNDHPDQLRIDLDPQPGTTFEDVRRVALEGLKPLLDELGFTGFVKTSGGRGVHVYVPIEPLWDFIATRRCVIAIARELERRDPDAVTTSWWKEERGERIFIDYNQNARDRTMASPYSVRRSARARVSTPVTWDELADVDPDDCTIATVPKLLEDRGDPWADIADHRRGVEKLLEMVQADDANGLGDMPYPPSYPKMPGEPPRVQPSKKVAEHWDEQGNRRSDG
ncbi:MULTISPECIES: DNA polymerase domain-containing protein [unclassified Gordonia (in: high G+C Gram-positive bacteria)]|uniref:DNA polymerase domain-containing protein n=1 Tax=unclassified Gordonia (in: high G+C Gram-positive bacteria) TaxID=2657482 RepID=UPI000990C7FE|nr:MULTISPECIES: DNA primase small subunit domain-containing protein [unclassified Gordonia (in: high G+C Gram-positive bacteria)]MBN0971189.1 ATP-dependent DNA ligase [Gordonia sp. BP-119]MBN0981809.1 ATP-dependent DNA ligase [Gordonia sp. BP-94]MCX2754139.1 ATP-dependent DNA ligase [Gordonia sp. 4N]